VGRRSRLLAKTQQIPWKLRVARPPHRIKTTRHLRLINSLLPRPDGSRRLRSELVGLIAKRLGIPKWIRLSCQPNLPSRRPRRKKRRCTNAEKNCHQTRQRTLHNHFRLPEGRGRVRREYRLRGPGLLKRFFNPGQNLCAHHPAATILQVHPTRTPIALIAAVHIQREVLR